MCQRPAIYPDEIAATSVARARGGGRVRGAPFLSPAYVNGLCEDGGEGRGRSSFGSPAAYVNGGGSAGYYGYGFKEGVDLARGRRRGTWGEEGRGDGFIRGMESVCTNESGNGGEGGSTPSPGLSEKEIRMLVQAADMANSGGIVSCVGGGGGGGGGRGDGQRRNEIGEAGQFQCAARETSRMLRMTSTEGGMKEVGREERGEMGGRKIIMDAGRGSRGVVSEATDSAARTSSHLQRTSSAFLFSTSGSCISEMEPQREGTSQSPLSSLESSLSSAASPNDSPFRGMDAGGGGRRGGPSVPMDLPFEKAIAKGSISSSLGNAALQTMSSMGSSTAVEMTASAEDAMAATGSEDWRMQTPMPLLFQAYCSALHNTQLMTEGGGQQQGMPMPPHELHGNVVPGVSSWMPPPPLYRNGLALPAMMPPGITDIDEIGMGHGFDMKGFNDKVNDAAVGCDGEATGMLPTIAQRGPRYCMNQGISIPPQGRAQGCTGMGNGRQEMAGYAGTDGNGSSDVEDVVVDEKKRRRMMSNRDSARRSRVRRQERLDDLERQSATLRVENSKLRSKMTMATEQTMRYAEENKRLVDQMKDLKKEMEVLRRNGPDGASGSGVCNRILEGGCDSVTRSDQHHTPQSAAISSTFDDEMQKGEGDDKGMQEGTSPRSCHAEKPDSGAKHADTAGKTMSRLDEALERRNCVVSEGHVVQTSHGCSDEALVGERGVNEAEKMAGLVTNEGDRQVLKEFPSSETPCTCSNHAGGLGSACMDDACMAKDGPNHGVGLNNAVEGVGVEENIGQREMGQNGKGVGTEGAMCVGKEMEILGQRSLAVCKDGVHPQATCQCDYILGCNKRSRSSEILENAAGTAAGLDTVGPYTMIGSEKDNGSWPFDDLDFF